MTIEEKARSHDLRPAPTETRTLSAPGLAVLLVAAALTMVDFFIVNVALPSIGAGLGAGSGELEWVVAGYGGTYAVLLVLGGRLGDAWGRRRIAIVGLIGFTATSAACGLAPGIGVLIAARVVQGAASALLLPQTLATIQAATDGERRGHAIGLYGAVGGLSAALGQVLGGVLVSWDIAGLGWRPIFLLNVPIGALLLFGMVWVPETRSGETTRIDGAGTATFAVAMIALVSALTLGPLLRWPWWTWTSLGIAVLAGAALIPLERRIEAAGNAPFLPPSLLKTPGMVRGLPALAGLCVAFGGFAFAFSITLQRSLNFDPLSSGLSLLPMAIGAFLASLGSSKLISRFGAVTVVIGGLVQAIGLTVVLTVTVTKWPDLAPWHFLIGMFLVGIGNGLLLTTIYRIVLTGVPATQAGAGSGMLNTAQQTAMSLGVAAIGTVFSVLGAARGDQTAFATVTVIWAVVAAVVAASGGLLPDPRPKPLTSQPTSQTTSDN